ncbi:unnamed protein product [marine sediment metagenome]|uniref:Uncharacterized protein n=1 Tax=marine sediment metagenome TaxID=412755 RepID=X0TJS8_9ZZZZ
MRSLRSSRVPQPNWGERREAMIERATRFEAAFYREPEVTPPIGESGGGMIETEFVLDPWLKLQPEPQRVYMGICGGLRRIEEDICMQGRGIWAVRERREVPPNEVPPIAASNGCTAKNPTTVLPSAYYDDQSSMVRFGLVPLWQPLALPGFVRGIF